MSFQRSVVLCVGTFFLQMIVAEAIVADEVAEVVRRSQMFEEARLAGDYVGARKLCFENATILNLSGRARRMLRDDLGFVATLMARTDREKLEPVRVVGRQVDLQGGTAVVTELLGADADVPIDRSIVPRRRTLIWARDGELWKILHVHTSAYSRWESAISAYEASDKTAPPKSGGVVFVGSSSIAGWTSLQQDFPEANVIGRGFGGSEVIDCVLNAHRIVTKYAPRRVVLYAGDNDIAKGKSAEKVFGDVKLFVETIHATLPDTSIGFIAIKPSLSRWQLWSTMKQANALVQSFAEQQDHVDYFDVATPMLGSDGKPNQELFVDDGLHMNPQGYAVWTKVLRPWMASLP